jgi:hypothetical protein
MIQKTLNFDTPTKLSRKSDKITSQKSAAETEKKLGTLHARCMLMFQKYSDSPQTANEVGTLCSVAFGGMRESYRKRAHELLRMQLIEQAGERKCDITGKTATTYKARGQS